MSGDGSGEVTEKQKKDFLEAYEKSLGNVSRSCKPAKFSRKTFYNICKNDEKFKAAVEELNGATGDFVESKLVSKINTGDTAATIFYCKTKLKHRGYIETVKNEHSGDPKNPIVTKPDLSGLTNDQLRTLATITTGHSSGTTES